jgi:hypothetical protein
MVDNANSEGIKISAPFYDVNTAGDINMIFSSSFPTIAVGFQKTFTLAAADYQRPIAHGLPFPPLAMLYRADSGKGRQSLLDAPDVDGTNVYVTQWDFPGTSRLVHLVCYAIDLSKTVDYPFIQQPQGQQSTYDPNYGIKLAKEGFDVSDKDLRNFIIHSRTRSPLVLHQQAVADNVNSVTLRYTNPGGYQPWVFGYGGALIGSTPVYTPAFVMSQAYPRLFIDPTTGEMSVSNNPGQGGLASLVVLRDPLFAGTQEQVTY